MMTQFNTISLFAKLSNSSIKATDLTIQSVLVAIKLGIIEINGNVISIEHTTSIARSLAKGSEEYKNHKKYNVPAVTWASTFSSGRNKETGYTFSGAVYFDVDGVDMNVEEAKVLIATIPSVKAVWSSISGKGIGGIFYAESENVGHFYAFAEKLEALGLPVDKAVKDVVSRANVLSFDPNVIIKSDGQVTVLSEMAYPKAAPRVIREFTGINETVNGSKAHQTAYNYTTSKGIAHIEGSRPAFITSYCGLMNQLGVEFNAMCTELTREVGSFNEARAKDIYNRYSSQFGSKSVKQEVVVPIVADLGHNNLGRKNSVIKAPEGAIYLNEFMTTLPVGILNKKECGCGATHLVLTNEENTVVAVPTVELITNKMKQLKNVFGIYGGVTYEEFRTYTKTSETLKIMVTYDSLPKLVVWMEQAGVDSTNCTLVVDEYHQLLAAYSYRDKAVDGVFSVANLFDKVTFLSATPITPEYSPVQLAEYDYTEIEWSNTIRVKPTRYKTNKPFNAAVNIIKKHKTNGYSTMINGTEAKELYFFLNSVTAIKDVIESAGLTNNEVKVICANSNQNRSILDTTEIKSALDENRPFTFVTSKAFMGSDFYSTSGLVIVVSNVSRKSTLLDPATDLYQIAGRIRNKENPFKNTIVHIFNTGASEMTTEEFAELVAIRVSDSNIQISSFNKMSQLEKAAWRKRASLDIEDDYTYYNVEKDVLEFNDLKMKNEQFHFSIVNEIYVNGFSIRDAYIKAGYDVTNKQTYVDVDETFIQSAARRSFADICKEYVDALQEGISVSELEREEPLLKLISEELGTGAFSSNDYNKTKLQNAIYAESNEARDCVYSSLVKVFKSGEFYSSKLIKETIASIYTKYKISKTAKSTDISDYFSTTESVCRVDGKTTKGFIVKYHTLNNK